MSPVETDLAYTQALRDLNRLRDEAATRRTLRTLRPSYRLRLARYLRRWAERLEPAPGGEYVPR